MKAESKYDLPLQIPSNKSVAELISKSPHLLRTHLAYFLSITLKNNDINLLNYLLSANTANSEKIWNDYLLQCTELGKCNMINLLLQKGHNPNVQNDYRETPLHIAASKGDSETMKILLLYKANCFIKTKENLTPYDYAIEQGDKNVIELLKRQKNNSMKIEDTARDTEDEELVSPRDINQVRTVKKYDMPNKLNINKLLLNNLEKNEKEIQLAKKDISIPQPQSAKDVTQTKIHFEINSTKKTGRSLIPQSKGIVNVMRNEIYNDNDKTKSTRKDILTQEKDDHYEELFCFPTNNYNDTNTVVKEEEFKDDDDNNRISFLNQNKDNTDSENDDDNSQQEEIKQEDNESEDKSDLLKTIPLELDENNILNSPFFNNICKDQQQHGSSSSNVDTSQSNNLQNSPSKNASNIIQSQPQLKPSDEVFQFLEEIRLKEYTQLLIKNGFDDIKLIIDQTKRSIAITEQNLIEAGINIPGDRAKILIHLEEKAKLFDFDIKKDNVYYKPINMGESTSRSDRHIQSLYRFLSSIKMECFLENFVNAGYSSIDLILLQMLSRQPLTESKLRTEFGIEKIGYRARLMTKFREEANNYMSKIRNRNIFIDSPKSESEFCNCFIF